MSLVVPAGSSIGHFFAHAYWAARLKDGGWRSEIDGHDWPADPSMIAQLWLFGVKMVQSDPQGNSAYLISVTDSEFFQEKGEHFQLIGRKDEQAGSCAGFVWDERTRHIEPYTGKWRPDAL